MTNSYATKVTRQAQLQQILSGLAKHYPNATFTLGGVSYTTAELTALIQAVLNAMVAEAQAKASYSSQVQVVRNANAKANPVLALLKSYVVSQVGNTQDAASALGDFGYTPRPTTKTTVKVKAVAVAKSLNTRAEHHIMGKKQRANSTAETPAIAPVASTTAVVTPKG
jgi:hypothetical protein